ncbi:MAG: ATP-binding protein [Streptosporangiaceae bacterium]
MRASSAVLLPHAPSSVAVARRRLCDELFARGVTAPAVDDAALVVSELLSNALRHARPLPSGAVRVAWRVGDEEVEVAVSDGGSPMVPTPRHPRASALGGRGLGIVAFVAETWGVHREQEETTVWAVLPAVQFVEVVPD